MKRTFFAQKVHSLSLLLLLSPQVLYGISAPINQAVPPPPPPPFSMLSPFPRLLFSSAGVPRTAEEEPFSSRLCGSSSKEGRETEIFPGDLKTRPSEALTQVSSPSALGSTPSSSPSFSFLPLFYPTTFSLLLLPFRPIAQKERRKRRKENFLQEEEEGNANWRRRSEKEAETDKAVYLLLFFSFILLQFSSAHFACEGRRASLNFPTVPICAGPFSSKRE